MRAVAWFTQNAPQVIPTQVGTYSVLSIVSPHQWEKDAFIISNQERLLSGTMENRMSSAPREAETGSREARSSES